ncbi:MAG: hypothetical protein MUF42_05725 [Cytophagaceae bacterium]|jgi:hypothetical protein|nr:hypothetical protein [Cytophagaceae bacterium]
MKNFYWIALTCLLTAGALAQAPAKLKRKKLYDGISSLMPKDFTPMSDLDLAAKYPSTKKPLAMFTSEDRNTDFGVNSSKRSFPSEDIEMLQKFYKANIIETYSPSKNAPSVTRAQVNFLSEGVREINGRKFAYYEFISEFEGLRKYHYIQLTLIQEHIYIFNFVTDQRAAEKWKSAVGQMMQSVKLADRIQLPVQEQVVLPKRTRKVLLNPKNKDNMQY